MTTTPQSTPQPDTQLVPLPDLRVGDVVHYTMGPPATVLAAPVPDSTYASFTHRVRLSDAGDGHDTYGTAQSLYRVAR